MLSDKDIRTMDRRLGMLSDKDIRTWDRRLGDQAKRGWENYVHKHIDLSTARVDQPLLIAGEFLYVESASDAVVALAKIKLNRNTNDALDLELGVEIQTVFTEIYLTNDALDGEWLDLIVGINFIYKKKIGAGDICPATFVIAASNATALERSRADVVCGGLADHVEIQAAIDALPGDGWSGSLGGRISLSSGTFHIGATIDLRGQMELVGQGVDLTRLILNNNVDSTMFEYLGFGGNNIFCKLRSMTLHGNSANQAAGHGIHVGDAGGFIYDLSMEHLFIYDFKEDGARIYDGWGNKLNDVIIEACSGYGVNVTYAPNHIKVIGCKIISNLKSGIKMSKTGNGGAIIVGNEIGTDDDTGAYYGLEMDEDDGFVVQGNLIHGGGHATSYPVHISAGCSNWTITGNAIWAGNTANYCIYSLAHTRNVISGNGFYQWITAPIYSGGNVAYHQTVEANAAQDMILPVAENTGAKTLVQSDSGSAWYAYYDAGATTFTLPSAVRGLTFTFIKWHNQDLIIQAAAGDKINNGLAAKKYRNNAAEAKLASVTIVAVDTVDWVILAEHGTWVNDNV